MEYNNFAININYALFLTTITSKLDYQHDNPMKLSCPWG